MSSPEQYGFETGTSTQLDQSQPNLLPSEFHWQPQGGTTGNTTQETTPVVGNGGIVPNNSGIVDGNGQYTQVDNSSQGGLPPMPGYSDGVVVPPTVGTDQGYVPQQGTDQGYVPIAPPQQQTDQVQPAPQTSGDNVAPTVAASSDGSNSQGGIGAMWLLDRGVSLGATGVAAAKFIPNLQTLMPEGASIPTLGSIRAIPKDEWLNAARTDLGKAMGGAWVGDTLLDATLLKGRDTSWKTLLVDVATPLAISRILPGFGLGKTIAATMGAHAVEKLMFEDKKE
jgi:hypothetical protein